MLSIELEKLSSTKVDSAQAATATSHKEWLDNKSKFSLFSSGKTRKQYYNQGEPRKSGHQTDLIQICQICGIAV